MTEPAGPSALRKRRRRGWVLTGTIAFLVVGVGGGVLLTRAAADSTAAQPPSAPAVQTAKVVRTDLVDRDLLGGTLGYGPETPLPGLQQGIATWLPAPGAVITRGQRLYAVDTRPVVLFYGATPLYRNLGPGAATGPDVRTVEENLAALGLFHDQADEKFTASTAASVRAWQKSLGLEQTGTITPSDVVVRTGPVRVSAANAQVGDRVGGSVLKVTDTERVVTVDLDTQKQAEAAPGAKVDVTLPDGTVAKGTITDVGAVATAKQGQGTGSTIKISIRLDDPAVAGGLVSAPVGVTFTAGVRKDVLAVPVGALLALREGGYGLEVVDGGTHRLIGVQLGLFAGGLVEVSGSQLRAGMTVATTS